MKTFIITYKRDNGTIDTSEVCCRSKKLTKSIRDYYYHINADILSIVEKQ